MRLASLQAAIEANGVAVAANLKAFRLGRLLAERPDEIELLAQAAAPQRDSLRLSETTAELVQRRVADLTAYQDDAYAKHFEEVLGRVSRAEQRVFPGRTKLTDAVARNYYKLLAYKDEYEVARLFTDGAFLDTVRAAFSGDYKLQFHMAPPIFSRLDPATGRPKKRKFGPWMLAALRVLAQFKALRGTAFDPFGYSAERKAERALIADYEQTMAMVADGLTTENYDEALAICRVPEEIRGYGPVKDTAMAAASALQLELIARFERSERRLPRRH